MSKGLQTGKYECGLSRLMHDELHWLVITQQVQYKLAVTVHRCLRHRAPCYLADHCVPVSEVPGRQHLRSASVINCQFCEFAYLLTYLLTQVFSCHSIELSGLLKAT